jgi:hypothetical protein
MQLHMLYHHIVGFGVVGKKRDSGWGGGLIYDLHLFCQKLSELFFLQICSTS